MRIGKVNTHRIGESCSPSIMSEERATRLRQARMKAGYTSAQSAAEAFGWGVSGYRHHENGTREFDLETAQRYARAFRADALWLLGMTSTAAPDIPPTRSSDVGDTVGIVQLDLSLSMGPGALIEDFVESEVVSFDASVLRRITRTPSDRLRFVTGIGTSHEPKFQHNDQFLIDINDRRLSRIDGYYWITFDGAHALKRLRPLGNGMIQVISDNVDFAPMELEAKHVRIEGRAIWFARGL